MTEKMNDNNFDTLMRQAIRRQDILCEIERNVLKEIKIKKRKALCRQWLRIAAFCIGFPVVLVLGVGGTVMLVDRLEPLSESLPLIGTIFVFSIIMIWLANRFLANFSFNEV